MKQVEHVEVDFHNAVNFEEISKTEMAMIALDKYKNEIFNNETPSVFDFKTIYENEENIEKSIVCVYDKNRNKIRVMHKMHLINIIRSVLAIR